MSVIRWYKFPSPRVAGKPRGCSARVLAPSTEDFLVADLRNFSVVDKRVPDKFMFPEIDFIRRFPEGGQVWV